MIISINNTQLKVMRKFIRHARVTLSQSEEATRKKHEAYDPVRGSPSFETYNSWRDARTAHDRFKFDADELLVRVGDRIDDLQRLLRSANNAAGAVR